MRAFHDTRSAEYRAPYGALRLGEAVELTLDVWEAPNATATLRTWIDGTGEERFPMTVTQQSSGGAQHMRFKVVLEPKAAGTVWYQFVIASAEGHEMRYGAQDGKMGGEGRLADWEPPSFKLSVYDPKQLDDGMLDREANQRYRETVIDYLCDEKMAPAFVEALEMLHEDYPEQAFEHALDLLGVDDRVHLLAQLAGVVGAKSEPRPNIGDYQLDGGKINLAKGRLWCASLIQALLPRNPFIRAGKPYGQENGADDAAEQAIAHWDALDFDCGNIAQNAIDLRRSLAPFQGGEPSWFAANDSVFGFWRRGESGEAACVLINASLRDAHDVLVPLETEAVTEVTSGYAVPIVSASEAGEAPAYAPAAERYARVHLGQLGSAVLYMHAEQRLGKPLDEGVGVLAHITSLPSDDSKPEGQGTLGAQAFAFVDRLAEAGIRYWQVLLVNPTDGFGSPYAGISAFAGNARLLNGSSASEVAGKAPKDTNAYRAFCEREADWLEPYVAFMAIRQKVGEGTPWQSWPAEYRSHDPAVVEANDMLREHAEGWRRVQFAFEEQWRELRAYANGRGVQIIGDMPIYVSADSADVWANPEIFQLGEDGRPHVVAGCPPDAFAVEGQVWGNPVYDWDVLHKTGYDWWLRRLRRAFDLYDVVRLDHFIGFARYFSIPAGKKATEGSYRPGPGMDFFNAAFDAFGPLPIIAEDLGLITPAVRALVAACGFPGMDIVQFADGNDPLAGYQPRPHKIVYTGTHDNQTLVGYAATRYSDLDVSEVADRLMSMVLTSGAPICVIPLQDVLALDDAARMNVPGTAEGNWSWQADEAAIGQTPSRLRWIVALHPHSSAE